VKTITFKCGTCVVIALVLLRLGIGWHFLKEGAKKFTDPDFSATSFLVISKGPLAGAYKAMISDADGLVRLDRGITETNWKAYRDQLVRHYGFDKKQTEAAAVILARRIGQLRWYLANNHDDIDEYRMELDWLEKAKKDKTTRDVESRRKVIETKERELREKVKPWLRELNALSEDYAKDLSALATDQQRARGQPAMTDYGSMFLINTMVKWTVILVGIFLMLGLFTRFWSVVGVGFLCSVISSQWPGWTGAEPTYYQVIELLALLVLIATNAGRFAGLDFFLDTLYQGYRAKVKKGNES